MAEPLHTILVPGLLCSPRLFAEQLPDIWQLGSVTIADHTRDADIASIARRVLQAAPAQFAVVGLSMGGYVALELARQAPERVLRLALLDTTARSDSSEQAEARRALITLAQSGRFDEVPGRLFARLVHRQHVSDGNLRQLVQRMAEETGPDAFVRQETAIMQRVDSRPTLSAIRCPTSVIVGSGDELTPPELAREMAQAIPGARLIEISGAGHLSPLERPREVAAALWQALSASGSLALDRRGLGAR